MAGRDLPDTVIIPEHNGMRLLKMIQARHPNYHPAIAISDLAHTAEGEDLQFRCHATLLKYVEPELRSVQIQADVKETRTIRVSLFETLENEISSTDSKRLEEALSHAPKLPAIMDVEVMEEVSRVEPVQVEQNHKTEEVKK